MNVFAVLINPEKEERLLGERGLICSAANALQVGEFQFLQLAYRDWFGEDLSDSVLDGLFKSYMLRNEVPHWARHYARSILGGQAGGGLDGHGPVWRHRGSPPATGVRSFWIATGVVVLTVASAIIAAGMATTAPTSLLPPFFERDELPRGEIAPSPPAEEVR